MALYGYRPKHKKAPWVGVSGLSQEGAGTPKDKKPLKRSQTRFVSRRLPIRRTWGKMRPRPLSDAKNSLPARRQRPIRRESPKKRSQNAEYRRLARQFVRDARKAGKVCPVFAAYDSLPRDAQAFLTQPWDGRLRSSKLKCVHHSHGRANKLLLYTPWFIAMSTWGHRLVHAFPALAREHGWMCSVGEWNTPPKEDVQWA